MSDPSTGSGQDNPTCPYCGTRLRVCELFAVYTVRCETPRCLLSQLTYRTSDEAFAAARRRAPVLTKAEASAAAACIIAIIQRPADILKAMNSARSFSREDKAQLERLAAKIHQLSEGVT